MTDIINAALAWVVATWFVIFAVLTLWKLARERKRGAAGLDSLHAYRERSRAAYRAALKTDAARRSSVLARRRSL